MDNSFAKYDLKSKDKLIVELLEQMNEKLSRIIVLLEKQGRISPAG
jgi:hypothetical protein